MARHVTLTEDDAKDLDETRRLMYMALLRQKTEKYELAGTIINALIHHQGIDDDPADVVLNVLSVIENADTDGIVWMQDQINRISEQLGD